MNGERLTWKEIVQKYPHQNVGLVDVEIGINSVDIKSVVVKCTDKDTPYAKMFRAAWNKEIVMCYTTRDEDFLIIGPQVFSGWEELK